MLQFTRNGTHKKIAFKNHLEELVKSKNLDLWITLVVVDSLSMYFIQKLSKSHHWRPQKLKWKRLYKPSSKMRVIGVVDQLSGRTKKLHNSLTVYKTGSFMKQETKGDDWCRTQTVIKPPAFGCRALYFGTFNFHFTCALIMLM